MDAGVVFSSSNVKSVLTSVAVESSYVGSSGSGVTALSFWQEMAAKKSVIQLRSAKICSFFINVGIKITTVKLTNI